MRFEEKLNLSIALEEVANTDDLSKASPNHRAIFDAIMKMLGMDIETLYDFATSGGYIEEGVMVINRVPSDLLAEQIISRTVHTGNYTRILEILIDKADPVYKVYTIVKLSVPDEKINAAIQNSMANWEKGDPLPFVTYNTEAQALKAMGSVEDREAGKAQVPTKPSIKPKKKPSPPVDVKEVAIQVATKMGKHDIIPIIKKMHVRDIKEAAKKGKANITIDMWTIAKTVFLGFLGIAALYEGSAGIAALIIGLFAVFWIENSRKK